MEGSLIYDENEIRRFITGVIKPLEDDEVYILLLAARKKYSADVSASQEVVHRDIIRDSDPNRMLRKIRRITNVQGIYTNKNTNQEMDPEAFVLYVLADPRSMIKGYTEFVSAIEKWQYDSLKGENKNLEYYRKLDVKLFGAIHRSRSRSHYFIVDIDKKDEAILEKVTDLLKGHIRWVSETHGGYHLIVDKNKNSGIIVYEKIRGMEYVEILKDSMTPLPGTLQGGFGVKGIYKRD